MGHWRTICNSARLDLRELGLKENTFLMPTHEETERFRRDLEQLTSKERELFGKAVGGFIADLQAWEDAGCVGRPQFRGELRVRSLRGRSAVWEVTWEYHDGRATFMYGPPVHEGKVHILWRRVGSHRIYENP